MRKYIFFTVIILIPLSIIASEFPTPQIPFNPKGYVCYKTFEPLEIDGKIIESSWKKAKWTDYFVDIEGELKKKPRFQTRVKMLWDDSYFYFACEMEEPHIWAKLKKRDSVIFYDNDFEIFIDPDGDTHHYYEFEMNAFNTVWDLFLVHPYRDPDCKVLDSWDIQGLKTAVDINGTLNNPEDKDNGWSVEVAIPWNVLEECASECPPKNNDQWRVNFSRVEWKTNVIDGNYKKIENEREDNWVWSPQGLINMHYPEMWGYVQFSSLNVGSPPEQFIFHKSEKVKWYLRKIYYAERNYYQKHNNFTSDLSLLEIKSPPQHFHPPEIEVTNSMFEVHLRNKTSFEIWHIRNDGKVWRSEK